MGPGYAVQAPWQPLLVQLRATMRTLQLLQLATSERPLRCSLLFAAPLYCFSLCFFFKASVDLELMPFGLLQLLYFRLFGLRGSVEI